MFIYLLTTRGCPGKCVFCASHHVHGRKVRSYSASRIKQDIRKFMGEEGFKRIYFYDDHFLADKKRALDLLEFMAENSYPCTIGNVAFFAVDADIARAMKKAGIDQVVITVENTNPHTFRKIIHKLGSLGKAKEAVLRLQQAGISVICNILTGFPGETKEAMDLNKEGLIELGCNWYSCFVVAPLPGSELYAICKEHGYISEDDDLFDMDYKHGHINTPDFTAAEVEEKTYEINLYANFVKNRDMRQGNYAAALENFELVLNKVIDTHAFAYYYAALCAKELGLADKYARYSAKYAFLVQTLPFWRKWSDFFQLVPLPRPEVIPAART